MALPATTLWLANCYFAHNSLRFPALLPFFNASSRRPFHPLNRYPDPVAPTWRRPFPRCGVPSAQTPAPDRKSLPATSAQSILVGPRPRRLDGALDPSYSSSPFRNRSEAFDTASPSQAMSKRKYRRLFSPNRRRKPGPKGPSSELIHLVVEMKHRNPRGCPRIAQQIALAFHIQCKSTKTSFAGFSPVTTGRDRTLVVLPG